MKLRIYTDTSAIGGCLDDVFRAPSNALFHLFKSGQATIVISNLTLIELEEAPAAVRAVLAEVPSLHREDVKFTPEAGELAEQYLESGVIGAAHRMDAQHIATATLAPVDILVS